MARYWDFHWFLVVCYQASDNHVKICLIPVKIIVTIHLLCLARKHILAGTIHADDDCRRRPNVIGKHSENSKNNDIHKLTTEK